MHLRVLLQSHQAPWCLPGFHVTQKLLLVRYFALVSFLKGYLSTGREFGVGSEQRGRSCCALPSHICLKPLGEILVGLQKRAQAQAGV